MSNKFKLEISKNNERCYFILNDEISNITLNEVLDTIEKMNIVIGIKNNFISNIIDGNFPHDKKFIIAEYIPPTQGKDGTITHLINNNPINYDLDYDLDSDNIDFHETKSILNVSKNDELIKIISPTIGKEGVDILGNPIIGLTGKEYNPKKVMGKNVCLDENHKFILADISGVYNKNTLGLISVSDEIIIPGNLDFSVGNIDTNSAVLIKGDIKSGFSCITKSSLTVEGVIEDAYIEVGETLVCNSGIIAGLSKIIVKETIRTKYIYDRECKCKNFYTQGIILGSTIFATNEVKAQKIVGGHIMARKTLVVSELGNNKYNETVAEVGINYDIIDKMKEITNGNVELRKENTIHKQELEELETKYQDILEKISLLVQTKTFKPEILAQFREWLKQKELQIIKLKQKITTTQKQMHSLKKRYGLIANKVEEKETKFIVREAVFPNVIIKIKLNGKYEVDKIIKKSEFYYNDENSSIRKRRILEKTFP